MKLLFSENQSDYANYQFPYSIWAIPEKNETPAKIFDRGFLPSSRELDRFYLCRHIRIKLNKFSRSSENRRILRKGEGINYQLIPRQDFDYTHHWREFCKNYSDIKFGKDVMTFERLDSLFNSKIISHLLLFTDNETSKNVGLATLYLEQKDLAYYYYAFYDLNYYHRNLGMFMMTSAVDNFSKLKYTYSYLGTCYSRNALYKTQFSGFQFFNGFRWSENLKELKYLINREKSTAKLHAVETPEFVEKFYDGNLNSIIEESSFAIMVR